VNNREKARTNDPMKSCLRPKSIKLDSTSTEHLATTEPLALDLRRRKQMQVELVGRSECETQRLRLKNILVPTDFSETSVEALEYASAFAQRFEATLWLIHIVEPAPSFAGAEGVSFPIAPSEPERLSDAKHLMAGFAVKHVPSSIPVTSLVKHGSAVAEISALAEERNIDLVIASTHGRTGVNRAMFGSVTERIVHHAPCPILIVREGEREFLEEASIEDQAKEIRLNRILVNVDFSDCSKKALRYAEALAKQFKSEIFCLHVLEPEKPFLIVETEGFRKSQRVEAERQMLALLKEMDRSIQVDSAIRSGTPRVIFDLADERKIDLIIVGEHQRSRMGRFLFGSTTNQAVWHARCPVLVVREIEHEFVE
jgi:nucleotide-binding universal stress UspA family protein